MRTSTSPEAVVSLVVFAVLAVFGGAGCTHDLDKLKQGMGIASGNGAGDGAGDGTTAGAAGDSSTSGSSGSGGMSGMSGSGGMSGMDGMGGTGAPACDCADPDAIKIGTVTVAPTGCCYGARDNLCGLAFDKSGDCYASSMPGDPDPDCDAAKGNLKQAGCCRPDAQCGVTIDAFDLGCVPLSDVPKAFGGAKSSTTCTPKCTNDKNCSSFDKALTCVEDKTHTASVRNCATKCERDADCKDNALGERCLLSKNLSEDRFDLYCGEKIGPVDDGQACARNEDCLHGLCVKTTASMGYCSRLCGAFVDCADGQKCNEVSAKTPVNMVTQTFFVCLNP